MLSLEDSSPLVLPAVGRPTFPDGLLSLWLTLAFRHAGAGNAGEPRFAYPRSSHPASPPMHPFRARSRRTPPLMVVSHEALIGFHQFFPLLGRIQWSIPID